MAGKEEAPPDLFRKEEAPPDIFRKERIKRWFLEDNRGLSAMTYPMTIRREIPDKHRGTLPLKGKVRNIQPENDSGTTSTLLNEIEKLPLDNYSSIVVLVDDNNKLLTPEEIKFGKPEGFLRFKSNT